MANILDRMVERMLERGYRKVSESPPGEATEAEMANENASETWIDILDPIQLSEHRAFWWRPHRGKDDLWMEITTLRGTENLRLNSPNRKPGG